MNNLVLVRHGKVGHIIGLDTLRSTLEANVSLTLDATEAVPGELHAELFSELDPAVFA